MIKKAGFLSYLRIPVINWYMLFNFYIYPEYRHEGYGKILFNKVLTDMIAKGATKIFIQPGPFELVDGNLVFPNKEEKEERIKKLVIFYEKYNFHLMSNRPLYKMMLLIYKIAGIEEDPRYLMIYAR